MEEGEGLVSRLPTCSLILFQPLLVVHMPAYYIPLIDTNCMHSCQRVDSLIPRPSLSPHNFCVWPSKVQRSIVCRERAWEQGYE